MFVRIARVEELQLRTFRERSERHPSLITVPVCSVSSELELLDPGDQHIIRPLDKIAPSSVLKGAIKREAKFSYCAEPGADIASGFSTASSACTCGRLRM